MRKISLFTLCLPIFLAWSNGYAAESKPLAKPVLTAVVTEKDGRETKVTNPTAYYVASGTWLGSTPTKKSKELEMVVHFEEDRIKVTDHFNFLLDELRAFSIGGRNDAFVYRFDKKDGTTMLFKQVNKNKAVEFAYEVIDREGNSTKLVKVEKFVLYGGEIQGQTYSLRGFDANAKTKSGREGTIFFDLDKVRNIKFD